MRILTTLLALLLLAAACGGADGGPGGPDGADGPVGDWELTAADPAIPVPAGARVTLGIDDAGAGGGSTPCNSYGGQVTWDDGGSFALDEVAVTEMGCEPDRTAAQEAYLDALLATTTWATEGDDVLVLTGAAGSLTFERVEPTATADLVGTTWELSGIVDGDSVSQYGDVDPARLRLDGDDTGGTFALTTGCREFAGEWVVDGDVVTLPSWGQVDDSRDVDDCTDDEVAQEDAVLGVVEGSFRTSVDGDGLTVTAADDDRFGLLFRATDGDDGRAGPPPGDDATEEVCEAAMAMPEDGTGFATREEALASFFDPVTGWWTPPAPGFSLDDATIMYEGREVGEVSLFQFTDGTWAISGYEVCYPAHLD